MRIVNVVGARPNFMKIAPICRALEDAISQRPTGNIEYLLVHTGQHYDRNMSSVFFGDLDIPEPDADLGVGSGTHSEQTAGIMVRFEKFCREASPDLILVVGDVNSTLACGIVGAKMGIPVGHVEAGLRSFDRTMPEEVNRVVTDAVSDLLFTSCRDADNNLLKEGIASEKIHFVGNVMIDTLLKALPKARAMPVKREMGLDGGPTALVTFHRPSNVDEPVILRGILEGLLEIAGKARVIFPAHPRTAGTIERLDMYEHIRKEKNIRITEPLGYLDFLNLMETAALVITDSGGIQEETTALGVPCLTFRDNTERPVTVAEGTNMLVGRDPVRMVSEAFRILGGDRKKGRVPDLWDGRTAQRIVAKVLEIFG